MASRPLTYPALRTFSFLLLVPSPAPAPTWAYPCLLLFLEMLTTRCAAKLLLLRPAINPEGWVSRWEGGPVALSRAPPPRLFPPPRPPPSLHADHPWVPPMQGCRGLWEAVAGRMLLLPEGLRPGPPPPPCPAAPLRTPGRPPAASACAADGPGGGHGTPTTGSAGPVRRPPHLLRSSSSCCFPRRPGPRALRHQELRHQEQVPPLGMAGWRE